MIYTFLQYLVLLFKPRTLVCFSFLFGLFLSLSAFAAPCTNTPGQVSGASGDTRDGVACEIPGRETPDQTITVGDSVDWSFSWTFANDASCTWGGTFPAWASIDTAGRLTGTSTTEESTTVTVTCGAASDSFLLTVEAAATDDWAFRQAHASTVRSLRFDNQSEIDDGAWLTQTGQYELITGGGIDGGNAMRLHHPADAQSGNNDWRLPFYVDERDQNDVGDVTYAMYAVKFPASWFDTGKAGDGHKVALMAGLTSTCRTAEFAVTQRYTGTYNGFYTNCGSPLTGTGPSGSILRQTGLDWGASLADADRYCLTHGGQPEENGAGTRGCVRYLAEEWLYMLIKIEPIAANTIDSDVWVYRRGIDTDWIQIMDSQDAVWSTAQDMSALWFHTYNTNNGNSSGTLATYHDYTEVSIHDAMPPAPTPSRGSALQVQADALAAGSSYDGLASEGGTLDNFDLAWHTTGHYDAIRQIIHIMGKPHGCTTCWQHRIYDIATDSWSTVSTTAIVGEGHIYGNSTINPQTGELYLVRPQDVGNPYRYDPDTQTWSSMGINMVPSVLSGTQFLTPNGLAYHPELYGPGDGGLILSVEDGHSTWRESNGAIVETLDGSNTATNAGIGEYFRYRRSTIVGYGTDAGPLAIHGPGSGGSAGTVSYGGTPPVALAGQGSGGALLIQHPYDFTRMLVLERDQGGSGNGVWWTRDASTFTAEVFTHPFNSADEYVVVSIPDHGVLFAVGADPNTGNNYTRIWKPDS